LSFAPGSLLLERNLQVFKFNSVVFKRFLELLKESSGGFDQIAESLLLVSKRSLLVFELGE
jgi:hypothetical protein